jgi:quercetin dioxygenase-like cupin family protein
VTYIAEQIANIPKTQNLVPVRLHFGISAFGVNIWTGDEGEDLVPEHTEDSGDEELYVVIVGGATFTVAGDTIEAPAGTLVYVSPGDNRKAVASAAGTQVLAIGATPGKAWEAGDWELWMPVRGAYEAKEYDRAIELTRQRLVEHPDSPGLVYNLACLEALVGRPDEALEHLEQAIGMRDSFREFARGDDDFAPLRDDPRFLALTGQTEAAGSGA